MAGDTGFNPASGEGLTNAVAVIALVGDHGLGVRRTARRSSAKT